VALVTSAELIRYLSDSVAVALLDDDRDGSVDTEIVAQIIADAEAEVYSYLPRAFIDELPLTGSVPQLLKSAARDFARSLCFQRSPEYVRTYGAENDRKGSWDRAVARMERIVTSVQRLPANTLTPGDVIGSGIVTSSGPRTIVPDDDGTSNLGDF
jgi:phage gp36-like protein